MESVRPKNLLRVLLLALLLQTAIGSRSAANAQPAQPQTFTLTILHTNDMHGHLKPLMDKHIVPPPQKVGGAAYLAGLIEKERARYARHNLLLLDAGDIAQGTPESNLFHGEPIVKFMNLMHYDAGTIGNHEFDWGQAVLHHMIAEANRPIVCANLEMAATGKLPAGVKPFILKKFGNVTVGITGVVTPTTPSISFYKNVKPFRFLAAAPVLRKLLPQMHKAGAQIIILISHLGDDADRQLAREVSGIDVIVGGHTHVVIEKPYFINGTIILQAGCYTKYLGRLNVTISRKTWKVVSYTKNNELIPVIDAKIKPDPVVAALVKKYVDKVAPAMQRVVGSASEDLSHNPTGNHCDSALGDLITDALRWKTHADVAVYNAGGIRTDFYRGPINVGKIFQLLPFDNYVVTLTLNGAQLAKLLADGTSSDDGTIQVSGITFKLGADHKPADILVDGKPLSLKHNYRLATVDFLAEGHDHMTELKKGRNLVYDELARDVFTSYVKKFSPLTAPKSWRILKEATH